MPKRSAVGKIVRRSAADLPPTTAADLARLRAAAAGPIDTSDIPEETGRFVRLQRDASGRLPAEQAEARPSPIRRAILGELQRQGMNRYQLWKRANAICPTLPQSAVYEFLGGRREIGLPYAEALMQAAGLKIDRPGRGASRAKSEASKSS